MQYRQFFSNYVRNNWKTS